jgi:hypothetical protein
MAIRFEPWFLLQRQQASTVLTKVQKNQADMARVKGQ